MTISRPDIAWAVSNVARWIATEVILGLQSIRIFRYLKGTINSGIVYDGNIELELCGYSDADYASDIQTRKSTSGFTCLVAGGAISWTSKLQATIAVSTCEAE